MSNILPTQHHLIYVPAPTLPQWTKLFIAMQTGLVKINSLYFALIYLPSFIYKYASLDSFAHGTYLHYKCASHDHYFIYIYMSHSNNRKVYFGCFYRPPDKGQEPFDELEKSLSHIDLTTRNNPNAVIILGSDFNVPHADPAWSHSPQEHPGPLLHQQTQPCETQHCDSRFLIPRDCRHWRCPETTVQQEGAHESVRLC